MTAGGRTTHYSTSLEVSVMGAATRVVWTTDLLPHDMAGPIEAMQEQALAIMKETLERKR